MDYTLRRNMSAIGVPATYLYRQKQLDIESIFTSHMSTLEDKPILITKQYQIDTYNNLISTPENFKIHSRLLISSPVIPRMAMRLATSIVEEIAKINLTGQHRINCRMVPLWNVDKEIINDAELDVLIIHTFDLDATRPVIEKVRLILDSMDGLLLILVAVAEIPSDVEKCLHREFDFTMSCNISTSVIY